MTEIVEGVAFVKHTEDNPDCPFCPGKEEADYKTWRGNDNKASKLRSNMKTPSNLTKIQAKARPKDSRDGRQSEDGPKPVYRNPEGPIYSHDKHGDYSDQAHHAISGNQILNGHDIEKLTCSDLGKIEKDTGYSVNNCANGVCLPAYPYKFIRGNSPLKGKWAEYDPVAKVEMMELPMQALKGQVHIGGHDISPNPALFEGDTEAADDATTDMEHYTNYPETAKKLLQKLYNVSIKNYSESCGFCGDNKKNGKKLPPPYRINQKLDDISEILIGYITGAPSEWKYFISAYAQDYVVKLRKPNRKRPRPNSTESEPASKRPRAR